MAVFIPMAAVGDVLEVRILKVAKTHAFGKIERILSHRPQGSNPTVPNLPNAADVFFRHIRYEEELRAKEQRVRDAVERIGGFTNLPFRPILGAPTAGWLSHKSATSHRRAKDGSLTMGFYAHHSHRIVNCPNCKLQPPSFQAAMEAFAPGFR